MVARERPQGTGKVGSYFASPNTTLRFFSSGSTVLDLALGGGWAENRIANIVGDKSTGKTLLCIEAAANFARKYPKGKILYRESEAAFDQDYAKALGAPIDRIDFGDDPLETVEDMFEDITTRLSRAKQPTLYICDSLDALSDRSEMERDMDQGTYGAEKAKKMSQLFRRLVRRMSTKHLTLIIVSQVRSKIGITFGRTTTRTGGRAMDFYASQVLYLTQLGLLETNIQKLKRATGIQIKAKVDKNKIGLPFREARFDIRFGYGIDDEKSCQDFLALIKAQPGDDIRETVREKWYEVERKLLPTQSKY